jgi:hypothetical protein
MQQVNTGPSPQKIASWSWDSAGWSRRHRPGAAERRGTRIGKSGNGEMGRSGGRRRIAAVFLFASTGLPTTFEPLFSLIAHTIAVLVWREVSPWTAGELEFERELEYFVEQEETLAPRGERVEQQGELGNRVIGRLGNGAASAASHDDSKPRRRTRSVAVPRPEEDAGCVNRTR